LTLKELKPEQHFTEPPPRYNEASLVKELEERGIGRPSTYATILSTIQERQYATKIGGKFTPTEIGLVVTDLLVENFKDIFDFQYTAHLEEELDDIEEGKETWTDTLGEFYKKFAKYVKYAEKHMENIKRMEKPTDEKCELCGSPLVIKWGKHGSFYACSTYDKENPDTCKFTKENPINLPDLDSADMQETAQEEYCENCGRVMVLKRGRFGQFMACTGYPDCKTTRRLDQGKRIFAIRACRMPTDAYYPADAPGDDTSGVGSDGGQPSVCPNLHFTLSPAPAPRTGSKPYAVVATDVNGDNMPDLVVANSGSGTVSVLLNQQGAFPTRTDHETCALKGTCGGMNPVAVYVGGHEQWLDNPKGNKDAGPGAVSRPGIGAIDPTTGKALAWNPTRTRGVGVQALVAVPNGLLVGSDTEQLGHEHHGRLGMFPLN